MTTPTAQPDFRPGFRRLALGLLAFFSLMVALRIHGFSLPLWRGILDGSRSPELLAGSYQHIRSDDWAAWLPNALAQVHHDPPFPVVNRNIGRGQNMLVYPHLPVWDPYMVFRPTAVGFFLGGDAGMAWLWWGRALGLFFCLSWLFLRLSEGALGLSLLGAASFVFSPFIQFWSYNCAEMVASLALALVCAHQILCRSSHRLLAGVGLWWSGSVFALGFYPAYQVPLTYAALGILGTLVWRHWSHHGRPPRIARRLGTLTAATVAILVTVAVFLWRVREPLATMAGTVYPGLRAELGGGATVPLLFSNFVFFFRHPGVYELLGNICEAGSFLFFFPLCLAGLALAPLGERRPWLPALAATAFVLAWIFVGFPEPLARLTAMNHVPTTRAYIALGLLNSVWMVAFLAQGDLSSRSKAVLAAVWGVALVGLAGSLGERLPGLPPGTVIKSMAWIAAISGAFLWRRRWALPALTLTSLAVTLFFNPLVRGGSEYLRTNPLSAKMLELGAFQAEPPRWVVFGSAPLGNLPKMLGLPSLSGQYFYPQATLWRELGVADRFESAYNRYATTVWRPTPGQAPALQVPQADLLLVDMDPADPALDRLGVRYFLVHGPIDAFTAHAERFEEHYRQGETRILSLRSHP